MAPQTRNQRGSTADTNANPTAPPSGAAANIPTASTSGASGASNPTASTSNATTENVVQPPSQPAGPSQAAGPLQGNDDPVFVDLQNAPVQPGIPANVIPPRVANVPADLQQLHVLADAPPGLPPRQDDPIPRHDGPPMLLPHQDCQIPPRPLPHQHGQIPALEAVAAPQVDNALLPVLQHRQEVRLPPFTPQDPAAVVCDD